MPPLSLKATVTRRLPADPVDQTERLLQAAHHEATENAATTEQEGPTAAPEPAQQAQDLGPAPEPEGSPAPETEKPRKQRTREEQREANAVQSVFLSGNLGKPVMVFTINGLRLIGKLRQFDQFTLLLEGRDGISSMVFKHAITTITATSDVPGKQR